MPKNLVVFYLDSDCVKNKPLGKQKVHNRFFFKTFVEIHSRRHFLRNSDPRYTSLLLIINLDSLVSQTKLRHSSVFLKLR